MDLADLAQLREQPLSITPLPSTVGMPSNSLCSHCEDDIPPERQKMGGVLLCTFCQNLKEKGKLL